MLDQILQQFTGGAADIPAEQLHSHVNTMVQQAPSEHVQGAIGDALQTLGPAGFGQSVQQAAQSLGPQQQQGLMGLLGRAIEGGGGSLSSAMNETGMGGANSGQQSISPGGLGALASYALQNHGGSLTSLLGNQASSGGSGVLSLLGNPMVRQVGTQLAQRLLPH